MRKILVVDDDRVSRDLLDEVLRKEGFDPSLAESAEAALTALGVEDFPIVLSDIRMGEKSGFDLLREIRRTRPRTVVVLMTGFGSMEGALDALREGAFDYISKPFQLEDLRGVVSRAMKHADHLRSLSNSGPGGRLSTYPVGGTLIGHSPKIVEVYKMLARASLTSSNILISGEAGTGKALVARSIHDQGVRKDRPFFKLSNAEDLQQLEDSIDSISGGTVFIEELVAFSPMDQSKILRILENDGRLRWIAATRLPISELRKEESIRSDLLDRLDIISMEIPPLRERVEDIPELVEHFLAKYSEKNRKTVSHLSNSAMGLLKKHSWPTNVRELERVVEKAVVLASGTVLEIEDFPELDESPAKRFVEYVDGAPAAAHASLESVEKIHIARVLEEAGYNKSKASEILGIDRATLYRKAKNYGIDLKGSHR